MTSGVSQRRLQDALTKTGVAFTVDANGNAIADPSQRASFNFVQGALSSGASIDEVKAGQSLLNSAIEKLNSAPGILEQEIIDAKVANTINQYEYSPTPDVDAVTISGRRLNEPKGADIITKTVVGGAELLVKASELYIENEGLAKALHGGIKLALSGGPVKSVVLQLAKLSGDALFGEAKNRIVSAAESTAEAYGTDFAERRNLSVQFSVAGLDVTIGPEEFGKLAGKLTGAVVSTLFDAGAKEIADRGATVSNIFERQKVGPHTVGEYRDPLVKGHHPHQQAARRNNENYNKDTAISVADDGTYDHAAISAMQRRLNAEFARTGKTYTLEVEEKIQRAAMLHGGMKSENIEKILELSRAQLKNQNALNPTRTPGTRR